jgi:hypothetical protein
MRQAMIASIPFASQELKPQLNAFGEPIKSSRNRVYSEGNNDPVWKLVREKGLRVPVPNTFFDDPENQYQYIKDQGQLLRKWTEANLPRLQRMNPKDAQNSLENAADSFRTKTRNKIMRTGAKKKAKKSDL